MPHRAVLLLLFSGGVRAETNKIIVEPGGDIRIKNGGLIKLEAPAVNTTPAAADPSPPSTLPSGPPDGPPNSPPPVQPWSHIATYGCSASASSQPLATASAYGTSTDDCFKLSDADINAAMVDSTLYVDFGGSGIYLRLIDNVGSPRPWCYGGDGIDLQHCPNAAGQPTYRHAQWRSSPSESWNQCLSSWSSSGIEATWKAWVVIGWDGTVCSTSSTNRNRFSQAGGFKNEGPANLWPATGWSSTYKMYMRIANSEETFS